MHILAKLARITAVFTLVRAAFLYVSVYTFYIYRMYVPMVHTIKKE